MARPKTKEELLSAAALEYEKLRKLIGSMDEEERNAAFMFEDRDRNVRDVLIHLYEWHKLLLKWLEDNINGTRSSFLPAPYNWRTYPQMNKVFWEKHQNTSYEAAEKMLADSHKEAVSAIEALTEEELFSKTKFSWTGTSNIGSYCISATSSHYDWAIKKLKKHLLICRMNRPNLR